jgi:hypothetical protein
MALKKYCVHEEVIVNKNTKPCINKEPSNNFHRRDRCDAGDIWHTHSELKAIKVSLFQLILLTSSRSLPHYSVW